MGPAGNEGRLAENILYFARALRAAGVPLGPGSVLDALAALFSGAEKIEREKQEVELDARFTVSDREVLEKKDFAQMTAAEIAAAKDAIKRMVLGFDDGKTRRLRPNPHGHRGDLRRTLRASMKS